MSVPKKSARSSTACITRLDLRLGVSGIPHNLDVLTDGLQFLCLDLYVESL